MLPIVVWNFGLNYVTCNKSVILAVSSVLTPFNLKNMISIILEVVQPLFVIARVFFFFLISNMAGVVDGKLLPINFFHCKM